MKKVLFLTFLGIILIVVIIIVFGGIFIVDQTKQAVVLRFGEIVRVATDPGLYFKTPLIDNVVYYDKRILLYDIKPEKIITKDKKTIVVDTYTLWRIKDPKLFMVSMRSINLALSKIDDVVYSSVRDIFAKYNFEEILSSKREIILQQMKERSEKGLERFGIEIVDVRVKRTDLPEENTRAVYDRMRAERYSIAAKIRAEGEMEAKKIRAQADYEAKKIISEAEKNAEIIKGTADASAVRIYAEAYSKSPELFELLKLKEIYSENMKNVYLILDPTSPLLKIMNKGE